MKTTEDIMRDMISKGWIPCGPEEGSTVVGMSIDKDGNVADPGCWFRWDPASVAADELTSLRALLAEAEKALEPFALLAEKWGVDRDDPQWADEDIMLFADREGHLSEPDLLVTVGDFRAARALAAKLRALTPKEGER